ncbi:MAG: MopE-related protein [Archangium sp.]
MRTRVISFVLLLAACVQVNPSARYSCVTTADCGPGYECIPRFEGASQCFREGECLPDETCNGADDNCDGRVDETFPEATEACTTTALGVCTAGTRACEVGQLTCASNLMASTEVCDGLDNDCDGTVDDGFDLTMDPLHCGACGTVCATGTVCRASRCDESACADGIDNDADGLADCDDSNCLGQVCDTGTAPEPRCGVLSPDAGTTADGGSRGCFQPEILCDNDLDDDGDGEPDCEDVDCNGRTCVSGNLCANRACPP